MSADDTTLYDAAGPGVGVPDEAKPIIEAIEGLETMSDDEVLERYKRSNRSAALFADDFSGAPDFEKAKYRLPLDKLPGFGEAYDGRDGEIPCGASIPHVCKGCGHSFEVGRTCSRNMCPRCAPAWVAKRAINHVGRLHEAAKMMSARLEGESVKKHHVIISPPKGMLIDAEDPYSEAQHTVRDIMEAMGMEGVSYYHAYRGRKDDLDLDHQTDFIEGHNDDRGEWKKRLFQGRNWEGDVREELERSPHFHVVGVCPWVPGGETTKAVYEATGWVIHRVTERNGSPISLGDLESVARAATYTLSHTTIDTTGDANRAMFRAYGSAYHKAEFSASTRRKAKRAVMEAATGPDSTLGLSSVGLECKGQLPEDECDHDHDLEDLEDLEGESSSSDDTDSGMMTCRGDIANIEDAAEFVEDEGWQQSALHADDAQATLDEWRDKGGWQGWVDDQQTITDDPPD